MQATSRTVHIDGRTANASPQMLYRGLGFVSGNNSSRLLMDYRTEQPESYWAILRLLFGREGLHMAHLKVEMGSDINSSSGTEPSTKRTADEPADVTRGAAYQLAADAKAINPDLTLDMLWWSEPKWVSAAEDVYAARYRWYKETLDAAWQTYGLRFDYVSAVQNERAIDGEWVKYLSAHLKAETDCPYDYSAIKIVAGDEVCTWVLADMMLADPALMDAVDVLGSHYTSWSTDNARLLANEAGKELWFSEACPAMSYAKGVCRFDGRKSGLMDIGGALDVANRIITMYPGGRMTLCEIQPAVAAYYDGVTYCSKQLILANEPWSGAYSLDSSFYALLHLAQFIRRGWQFVESACYADGKAGGDGHAIVDALYSYVTAMDPATGDYSIVITNTTDAPIAYDLLLNHLPKADAPLYLWETRGPDGGEYDENYFRYRGEVHPVGKKNEAHVSVTVAPYSIITLSTMEVQRLEYTGKPSRLLALPFEARYDAAEKYYAARGGAPRYTTDQGGAFEVRPLDGQPVLMQMITEDLKANEWGATPSPVTCLGDDRWLNYSVSAQVLMAAGHADAYAGIGLRYVLGGCGENGYWVKLDTQGCVTLMKHSQPIGAAVLEHFDPTSWHTLGIKAVNDSITACVDDKECIAYTCGSEAMQGAGRAALYSSYHHNCFRALMIRSESTCYAVSRLDDMDGLIDYDGDWDFTTTGGWTYFRRTSSTGRTGARATFAFTGTGFSLFGENKTPGMLRITLDGMQQDIQPPPTGAREVILHRFGLTNDVHRVQIEILSGALTVDGVELIGQ